MRRPRIHWLECESAEVPTWWTPGWLPDTQMLRWSLANDLRIEGVTEGWHESFASSDAAMFFEGYVAEDESGEWVHVTTDGKFPDGEQAANWRPATFARLDPPVCD